MPRHRCRISVYLLDTDIVSALRKMRPHGALVSWLEGVAEADLHISVVTLAGAYMILPMDASIFRLWAKLMHRQSNTVYEDAMIAARRYIPDQGLS